MSRTLKLSLLVLGFSSVFADNTQYFNDAYETGKQNPSTLNINSNSTYTSYATSKGIESNISNGANAGTQGSQAMTSSAYADKNYLYNKGVQDIKDCQSKSDPRCSTMNKYADKDTQNQFQAYSTGIKDKYFITTRPDPSDSMCTLVKTKQPVNPTTETCISAPKDQTVCMTTITPYNNYIPPVPPDGTVVAAGAKTVNACGSAWARADATATVTEALTKGGSFNLLVQTSGNAACANPVSSTFNQNISLNSFSQTIYNRDDTGCGGGHWDIGNTISVAGGCQGTICNYTVTINARHGGIGGQCHDSQTGTFVLSFTKPKVSSYDTGSNIDDECKVQKVSPKCKLINYQCSDNAPTKTINGYTFYLSNMCSQYGLTGDQCCWSGRANYYCGDGTDTCDPLRKNANCTLDHNDCKEKDYITGLCTKFQSSYSCSQGFQDAESKVCTSVVCAANESGTAQRCYSPPLPNDADNTKNFSSVIAYLNIGQNMAQDMKCSDPNHPENCTLFAGKYFNCFMYKADPSVPGSIWNNGADCSIHSDYFTQVGAPLGSDASDKNIYSQATSGTNNVMGSPLNYGIANDNSKPINNTISLQQSSGAPAVNKDEGINYTPNSSRNSSLKMSSGQVTSTLNQDKVKAVGGFTSFTAYLYNQSVNLGWNRQKAESNVGQIKNTTFGDEGITRRISGNPFGWHSDIRQPIINGLCVHLADSCEGGDDDATNSDLVKTELAAMAAYSNPNFCAKCTSRMPLTNSCLTGEPKAVKQEWCCFDSKISMDINLAAYDQGLLNFYTGNGSRYSGQVQNNNNICGGVTVGMISKIDFSKGNYFKDLMDSIDYKKIVDTKNFTDVGTQGNTQGRSNTDATTMINEWKSK